MRMIGMPKNFIGARPGRVYSWGGSASIQTASGTVVTFPQSAERAFSGLSIYGHSTQDGTPSPENPVPIVSAGSVMTTGAQLFDASLINGVQNNGISATHNANGSIKVTGIIEKTGGTNLYSQKFHLNEGEYSIGLSIGVDFYVSIVPYNSTLAALDCNIGNTSAHGFIEDGDYTLRFYRETESNENINFEVYVMINSGSTALPWEPYTGRIPGVNPYEGEINVSISGSNAQSQTLPISTPGGLPGIPVTSGGNYTDESGQQWICDEIDLKSGKYVQRVKSVTFDGSENWGIKSSDEGNQYFSCDSKKPDYAEDSPNMNGLSNMVKVVSHDIIDIHGDNNVISWIFYWRLRLSNLDISAGATVDDLKQFLSSNPITVYYTAQSPIETDLPAEEIAAYKALHTYSPTTTVSNDANAWMKVEYKG